MHVESGLAGYRIRRDGPPLRLRTIIRRIFVAFICLCAAVLLIKAGHWILLARQLLEGDIAFDRQHDHGRLDGHPDVVMSAKQQAELARRRAEELREEARRGAFRPWVQAGETMLQDLQSSMTRYAAEMRTAPMRCREGLQSRLPADWVVTGQSLGSSAAWGSHQTWRVSGVLTVMADGRRRSYHYQCDFLDSDLTDAEITDPHGIHDTLVLLPRP